MTPLESLSASTSTPVSNWPSVFSYSGQMSLPDMSQTGNERYVFVDSGPATTCAIRKKDKGIDCWGLNDSGQASPPKTGKYIAISVGLDLSCAIRRDKKLLCWGFSAPQDVPGKYLDVKVGDHHVCAIGTNQIAQCWGDDTRGQTATVPVSEKLSKLSVMNDQACGITKRGLLVCWGDSAFTLMDRPTGLFTDVAVGQLFGCAIRKTTGALACWGNNLDGVANPPTGAFKKITAGDYHACAIDIKGDSVCWGNDQYGQNQEGDSRSRHLSADGNHTCWIDNKSHIQCVGSYQFDGSVVSQVPGSDILSSPEKVVTQGALSIVSTGVTTGLGWALNSYGSSLEASGDEKGAKLAYWAAATFGLKGAILRIEDRIMRMQKDIEVIKRQLDAIRADLNVLTLLAIPKGCDDSLRAIQTYRDEIYDAWGVGSKDGGLSGYLKIVDDASKIAALKQNPNNDTTLLESNLRQLMTNYAAKWHNVDGDANSRLLNDLRKIHEALLNYGFDSGQNLSPLQACLDTGLQNFRTALVTTAVEQYHSTIAFDDRNIYDPVYKVYFRLAQAQGVALQLINEINAFKIAESVRNVPDFDVDAPVCSQARSKGNAGSWSEVNRLCSDTANYTKYLYRNLIQQVEYAGAPYSDGEVVLSLSSKVSGVGTSANSWLWPRHYNKLELSRLFNVPYAGLANDFDLRGSLLNYGATDKFPFTNTDWHLGTYGYAWDDVYDDLVALKKKRGITGRLDLLEEMARSSYPIGSSDPLQGMTGYLDKVFWKGKGRDGYPTFEMDWGSVSGFKLNGYTPKDSVYHCFVASKVNRSIPDQDWSVTHHPLLNEAEIDGKVCSSGEFLGLVDMQTLYGFSSTFGNGGVPGLLGNVTLMTTGYKPYLGLLGPFRVAIGKNYFTFDMKDAAFYQPEVSGRRLFHLPILAVDKSRNCRSSMVMDGKTQLPNRATSRIGALGVEIPSRCGLEMDQFIEALIPRPITPWISSDDVRTPRYIGARVYVP